MSRLLALSTVTASLLLAAAQGLPNADAARKHRESPPPPLTTLPLSDLEPPPDGDEVVVWAVPQSKGRQLKIWRAPRSSAQSIGDARGTTALRIDTSEAALRRLSQRPGRGCRTWLPAVPVGYVCGDGLSLQPGYRSAPPAQPSDSLWQRYRYGVVKVAQALLSSGTGQFLRQVLRRGDGVTVVREAPARGLVQLHDRRWLPQKDVELVSPPAVPTLDLQTLSRSTDLQLGWLVPALGESQVPIYEVGSDKDSASPQALIPRYTVVQWTEGKAAPGRITIQLSDEQRPLLQAYPHAQAHLQFEVPVGQLRRLTLVSPPPEISPEEHWIDISLSEQVAVGYVGSKPQLAALVSTGPGGKTPPGSFVIYRKYLTQTMANQRGAASQYDFREVPHAQFFNGRIGLHAVLWHDRLGHPVSHGCVNLSPSAAAQFFAFTGPKLPPGWHSITGSTALKSAEKTSPPDVRNGDADKTTSAAATKSADATVPAGEDSPMTALRGTRVVVRK